MVIWWVVLAVVVVVYVCLNAIILPKIFLLASYDVTDSADRGIKTVDEIDGRSIIYEPSLSVRNYINQYILSERNGKKFVVCKYVSSVKYIEYSVVLFNQFGEVFSVMEIKEIVDDNHISKSVELPKETVYATLLVNVVNNKKMKTSAVKKISTKRIFAYSFFSTITVIACVLCAKLCIAKLFGGLFDEVFLVSLSSIFVTAVICVALIALNAVLASLIIKGRN
jgi:hypothetical protein